MLKKVGVFSLMFVFLSLLGGCATMRKENNLEIQRLRNQITVLESQLQTKEDEINSLKESIARQAQQEIPVIKETAKKKTAGEVKSRPNVKQIQSALKNAGFDAGEVDGKMGKKTVDAIKAFQQQNNLNADGKVGKETWNLLKEYLYKKVK